jgi:hypothetical protein
MSRRDFWVSLLAVLLLALLWFISCSQSKPTPTTPAPPTPVPRQPAPKDPGKKDNKPVQQPPKKDVLHYTEVGEWCQVGEVRVKIDKVELKQVILVFGDQGVLASMPDLVVWLLVENRSEKRDLDYPGWDGFRKEEMHDNRGNSYSVSHPGSEWYKGIAIESTLRRGAPPQQDAICFEKPLPQATDLFLSLPPIVRGEKGKYLFRIRASAWK